MDNLCNNCIHKDICARRMATWGMKSCEHFLEMPKKGEWTIVEDDWNMETIYECSACKEDFVTIEGTPAENLWNFCPNCGADMRGKEDG